MGSPRSLRIEAIHLDQDDPKKCTARKLERAGLIKCKSHFTGTQEGVLPDPLADHILSPADSRLVVGGSLVALDCSWKKIEDSVRMIKRTTRLNLEFCRSSGWESC